MSQKHDHGSRRNFLKIMGLQTGLALYQTPIQLLIEAIVTGAQRSAWAAGSGSNPRRHLDILQQGAPPRWTFDLFLTPYSQTGFVQNPQVGTTYNFNSKGASTDYTTVSKAGMNVPHIWGYTVPSAAGGERPLDALLSNMISLRGINVTNPSHDAAQTLHYIPAGSAQSFPAMAADASSNPIAAVSVGGDEYKFNSRKGKTAVILPDSGNLLSSLLTPFTPLASGTFLTNKQKVGSALDAAVSALNAATEVNRTGVDQLTHATEAAKDLLSDGFGDMTKIWNTLLAKYVSLISRVYDPGRSLPGINDSAIVPDGTTKFQLDEVLPTSTKDIRTLITAKSGVIDLANHFAMAEFVLINNLSSSVSIAPSHTTGLTFNGSQTTCGTDEHNVGGGISTLINTYFNLAYGACLLELIDQLKLKNMFNDTVISMAGEFCRTAHLDGSGSDHGYTGSTSTFYSGSVTSPLVLGNIYNNKSQSLQDGGTWGMGAPVAELGRSLSLQDVAATAAYLLQVPSPTTAASSLVVSSLSGGYTSVIEKAKQVT